MYKAKDGRRLLFIRIYWYSGVAERWLSPSYLSSSRGFAQPTLAHSFSGASCIMLNKASSNNLLVSI